MGIESSNNNNKKNNVIKKIFLNNKKLSISIGILLIISIYLVNFYGILLSDKAKTDKIHKKVYEQKYSEAKELNYRYFSKNDEATVATKSALDYVITTCEKYKVRNMTEFFELVNQTKEEYMENKLEN